MSVFRKRSIHIGVLRFFGINSIGTIGPRSSSYLPSRINVTFGTAIRSGLGKRIAHDIHTAGNSAITVGVAVQSTATVLALTNLTEARQVVTAGITQPDVPRTLRLVGAKTGGTNLGNGGFAAANSRYVRVTGTNVYDEQIVEDIPVNDTSSVQSINCFKSITSIDLPAEVNATGDQISVGVGTGFPFYRPVAQEADVLEFARKASAATAYTIETLGTLDVAQASTTLNGAINASTTTIVVADGSGFPAGSQRTIADIISGDGDILEQVYITNRSTNTLTVARGANGTTARAWSSGVAVVKRPGNKMTIGTVTANDRFRTSYLSEAI